MGFIKQTMNEFPYFSIIIPVYNAEKYLTECIDSIVEQTYKNLEIICVNDGSTDRSFDILQKYQKDDCRIYIINQSNSGPSSARNAGLGIAKGRFVWFVDADDYIEQRACERLYQVAQQQNPDVVIFGAYIFPLRFRPPLGLRKTLTTRNKSYHAFTPEVLFIEPGSRPFLWNKIYRLSYLNKYNLRFEKTISVGGDHAFQLIAFPRATGFAFIADKLYHYRWMREGSITSIYKNAQEQRFKQHLYLAKHTRDQWNKSGDLERMPEHFLKWSLDFLGPDLISFQLNNKSTYAHAMARLWQGFDLATYKKNLTREQLVLLNYVTFGRMPFRSKLYHVMAQTKISRLFRCLKNHGPGYSVRLAMEILKDFLRLSMAENKEEPE